jgi:hypothetical protein
MHLSTLGHARQPLPKKANAPFRHYPQARNEISRLSEAASRSRDRPPNSAP